MPGKKRKQLPLMLSPFETEALEVFARRLRRARLRRNLTQTAVAERAGVSRGAVAAAESGAAGTSLGTVVRMLGVYGLAERLGEVIAVDIDAELIDEDLGRQRSRPKYKPADF
jgi:transcriptional regulator with XRE-family HTH domain